MSLNKKAGRGREGEGESNVEKRKFRLAVKCRQPAGIKKATRQLPGSSLKSAARGEQRREGGVGTLRSGNGRQIDNKRKWGQCTQMPRQKQSKLIAKTSKNAAQNEQKNTRKKG